MKIYAECHAYFIDLEIKSMELILFDCYGVISSFGDISKRQVVYLYTVLTRLITPACSETTGATRARLARYPTLGCLCVRESQ